MFSGCTNLANIDIHNAITRIYSFAFSECIGLTKIYIPNSVTSLGDGFHAFENCDNLVIITHADSFAAKFAEQHGIPYETINS
jgi:hypothetical protein